MTVFCLGRRGEHYRGERAAHPASSRATSASLCFCLASLASLQAIHEGHAFQMFRLTLCTCTHGITARKLSGFAGYTQLHSQFEACTSEDILKAGGNVKCKMYSQPAGSRSLLPALLVLSSRCVKAVINLLPALTHTLSVQPKSLPVISLEQGLSHPCLIAQNWAQRSELSRATLRPAMSAILDLS